MNLSTRYAIDKLRGTVIEPAMAPSIAPNTGLHNVGTCSDTPFRPETDEQGATDAHGLCDGAPLVFAVYRVATECYPKLLDRTLGEEAAVHRLRKLVPKSAFQIEYVTRQAFKLINPRGHGSNSARFSNETLGWFRHSYPADAHLTAGLILLVCAAKWWTHNQGIRSINPRLNPMTTSDLDKKLKSFGFLAGERQAICRMLRRNRN